MIKTNLECAKSFVEAEEDWSRPVLHHLVPHSLAQAPEHLHNSSEEKEIVKKETLVKEHLHNYREDRERNVKKRPWTTIVQTEKEM